jgi:Cft2 family RNA processing exonuclease
MNQTEKIAESNDQRQNDENPENRKRGAELCLQARQRQDMALLPHGHLDHTGRLPLPLALSFHSSKYFWMNIIVV